MQRIDWLISSFIKLIKETLFPPIYYRKLVLLEFYKISTIRIYFQNFQVFCFHFRHDLFSHGLIMFLSCYLFNFPCRLPSYLLLAGMCIYVVFNPWISVYFLLSLASHKGWYFRDDCAEFFLKFMIPWSWILFPL